MFKAFFVSILKRNLQFWSKIFWENMAFFQTKILEQISVFKQRKTSLAETFEI